MSSEASLRLVLWQDVALDGLAANLEEEGAPVDVTVERLDRGTCGERLTSGLADIALLPAVTVLSDPGSYDIYPAVAVSSWCSRTARIVLRNGFGRSVESMACDTHFLQEALMARIVLREHYGMEPQLQPVEARDPADLMKTGTDAVVLVGDYEPSVEDPGVVLDLGREWFEFTNYPMVWGLFVSRKGEADARVVRLLRASVADLELHAPPETEMEEMVSDADLRYRLDDIAQASLTELCDLLFFYKVTAEIPAVIFASDPDAMEYGPDDGDERELEI